MRIARSNLGSHTLKLADLRPGKIVECASCGELLKSQAVSCISILGHFGLKVNFWPPMDASYISPPLA